MTRADLIDPPRLAKTIIDSRARLSAGEERFCRELLWQRSDEPLSPRQRAWLLELAARAAAYGRR